eukprot:scaffold2681_cov139-Isochrysis_galbana.AAC.2
MRGRMGAELNPMAAWVAASRTAGAGEDPPPTMRASSRSSNGSWRSTASVRSGTSTLTASAEAPKPRSAAIACAVETAEPIGERARCKGPRKRDRRLRAASATVLTSPGGMAPPAAPRGSGGGSPRQAGAEGWDFGVAAVETGASGATARTTGRGTSDGAAAGDVLGGVAEPAGGFAWIGPDGGGLEGGGSLAHGALQALPRALRAASAWREFPPAACIGPSGASTATAFGARAHGSTGLRLVSPAHSNRLTGDAAGAARPATTALHGSSTQGARGPAAAAGAARAF